MRRSASALVLLALASCSSRGSTPVTHGPSSLRVAYSDGSAVEVQEPYRARTTGKSTGLAWSEAGVFSTRSDGTLQLAAAEPPTFAGPDGHLLLSLPVALRQGLVALGETSSVLGRPCREWTSLEPLDGAPFAPATSAEQTVTCVGTADGLVLRDRWTKAGAVLQERTATRVDRGPSLAGTALVHGAAQSPPPRPTSYTEVTPPGADLSGLFAVPSGPPGQRQDLAVASRELDATGGTLRELNDAGTVTWVGDGTLTVLTVTEPLAGSVHVPTSGAAVALGTLVGGRETPTYTGLRLDGLTAKGHLVTVRSSLPEDVLLAWARALVLP